MSLMINLVNKRLEIVNVYIGLNPVELTTLMEITGSRFPRYVAFYVPEKGSASNDYTLREIYLVVFVPGILTIGPKTLDLLVLS